MTEAIRGGDGEGASQVPDGYSQAWQSFFDTKVVDINSLENLKVPSELSEVRSVQDVIMICIYLNRFSRMYDAINMFDRFIRGISASEALRLKELIHAASERVFHMPDSKYVCYSGGWVGIDTLNVLGMFAPELTREDSDLYREMQGLGVVGVGGSALCLSFGSFDIRENKQRVLRMMFVMMRMLFNKMINYYYYEEGADVAEGDGSGI